MELNNLPIPPTVNHMYRTLPNYRRCKTKYLIDFEKDMELWAMVNKQAIYDLKSSLKEAKYLSLELTMTFTRDKLICHNGKVKVLDISNRIKAIEDAICGLIGLDDSLIFDVKACKRVGKKVGVTAKITPIDKETIGLT